MMKFARLLAATTFLAAGGISTAAHAQISPAYTYTSAGSLNDSRAFTLGFAFSVTGGQSVNALGYSTLNFTSPQTVGLWNSAGTLLTSITINPGAPVVSNYAWANITPLSLAAGNYVLGGTFTGGSFIDSLQGVTYAPGYSYLGDRQVQGSGLQFPTFNSGTYGTQGIALVNLSFGRAVQGVPEPATWAMMMLGFGAMGVAMRRRPKVGARIRFA